MHMLRISLCWIGLALFVSFVSIADAQTPCAGGETAGTGGVADGGNVATFATGETISQTFVATCTGLVNTIAIQFTGAPGGTAIPTQLSLTASGGGGVVMSATAVETAGLVTFTFPAGTTIDENADSTWSYVIPAALDTRTNALQTGGVGVAAATQQATQAGAMPPPPSTTAGADYTFTVTFSAAPATVTTNDCPAPAAPGGDLAVTGATAGSCFETLPSLTFPTTQTAPAATVTAGGAASTVTAVIPAVTVGTFTIRLDDGAGGTCAPVAAGGTCNVFVQYTGANTFATADEEAVTMVLTVDGNAQNVQLRAQKRLPVFAMPASTPTTVLTISQTYKNFNLDRVNGLLFKAAPSLAFVPAAAASPHQIMITSPLQAANPENLNVVFTVVNPPAAPPAVKQFADCAGLAGGAQCTISTQYQAGATPVAYDQAITLDFQFATAGAATKFAAPFGMRLETVAPTFIPVLGSTGDDQSKTNNLYFKYAVGHTATRMKVIEATNPAFIGDMVFTFKVTPAMSPNGAKIETIPAPPAMLTVNPDDGIAASNKGTIDLTATAATKTDTYRPTISFVLVGIDYDFNALLHSVEPTFIPPAGSTALPAAQQFFGNPLYFNYAIGNTIERKTIITAFNTAFEGNMVLTPTVTAIPNPATGAATFVVTDGTGTGTALPGDITLLPETSKSVGANVMSANLGVDDQQFPVALKLKATNVDYTFVAVLDSIVPTISPNMLPVPFLEFETDNPFYFEVQAGFPDETRNVFSITNGAFEGTITYDIMKAAQGPMPVAPAGGVTGTFTTAGLVGCATTLSPGQVCVTQATYKAGNYGHKEDHNLRINLAAHCVACNVIDNNLKLVGKTVVPMVTVTPADGSVLTFPATSHRTSSYIDVKFAETTDKPKDRPRVNVFLIIDDPILFNDIDATPPNFARREDFSVASEIPLILPSTDEGYVRLQFHPVRYRGPSSATVVFTPNTGLPTKTITYTLKGVNSDGPLTPSVTIATIAGKFECAGDTVTLKANVVGGYEPITYQWSNTAGVIVGATDSTLVVTAAETYSVVITDELGTTATTAGVVLAAPPTAPTIATGAVVLTPTSCVGRPDGSAKFTVTNPNANDQYLWRRTCSLASPLCSTVTITDVATGNAQNVLQSTSGPPLFGCTGRADLYAGWNSVQIAYNGGKCLSPIYGIQVVDAAAAPSCPPPSFKPACI